LIVTDRREAHGRDDRLVTTHKTAIRCAVPSIQSIMFVVEGGAAAL
jgi:hypothetical protein